MKTSHKTKTFFILFCKIYLFLLLLLLLLCHWTAIVHQQHSAFVCDIYSLFVKYISILESGGQNKWYGQTYGHGFIQVYIHCILPKSVRRNDFDHIYLLTRPHTYTPPPLPNTKIYFHLPSNHRTATQQLFDGFDLAMCIFEMLSVDVCVCLYVFVCFCRVYIYTVRQ